MDEADRRRELGAQIKRIVNLTKYMNLIRQLDNNWMINNMRPASIQLRMDMFQIANEYIQEEWADIKRKFDEIFDILNIR